MASKAPVIRQIAWISIVPQLFILFLFVYGSYLIGISDFFQLGIVAYLVLSFVLRRLIPREHRLGMEQVKGKQYDSAISHFKSSYDHFTRYSWIDKYRFVTLLSSSSMCYREMALNNIAFCYGQINQGNESAYYYKKTIEEFPDNEIAKASLRLLESGKHITHMT
ncbi:tetratricopeptide repeat protein [Flavihumibacter solisilvae]|uniref:Tetratricopeptide repeat protein n=1 Tax=Flavihumibacter solisilvae TaxID=1349421 RepID=A0A0C1I9I1_9BACT|nr:hypothetical protein [Flavihumibacter solisilvae]KIC90670.1 hypothetical protein OI18_23215 [Flavihumibacter solisilvae]